MTVDEMAIYILLVLIVIAGNLRLAIPGLGVITVYRRGGLEGPVSMTVPGRNPTAVRACEPPYVARTRGPLFDGVVVSSARGGNNLLHAVATARQVGGPLVVLASRQTKRVEANQLLEGIPHLALDTWAHLPDPRLRTYYHPSASTFSDVSQKRNAGLVIARMLGWRTVLFLDDDVRTITREELAHAAEVLAGTDRAGVQRRLVGWAFEEFPDLSAVGHAFSCAAHQQVSFIGGGAMAMRCDPLPPFFPPVYNEDLLVGLEVLRDDPTSACVVGVLEQDAYAPFDDPLRAMSQEFGEVLVEGLRRKPSEQDLLRSEFWSSVLRDRRTLISATTDLLHKRDPAGWQAMHAALSAHQHDWPGLLTSFVCDWAQDTNRWREFLVSLPVLDDLNDLLPPAEAGTGVQ